MKRLYEAPIAEELLILSESIMTDSSEIEEEEEILEDDGTRDIFVGIQNLLGLK